MRRAFCVLVELCRESFWAPDHGKDTEADHEVAKPPGSCRLASVMFTGFMEMPWPVETDPLVEESDDELDDFRVYGGRLGSANSVHPFSSTVVYIRSCRGKGVVKYLRPT